MEAKTVVKKPGYFLEVINYKPESTGRLRTVILFNQTRK